MSEGEAHEPAERWVAHAPPVLDLLSVERMIVVRRHRLDRVVVRRVRLDDDASALGAAAGAPGDLLQQLKRALAGAEVGQVERDVGGDDADERDERDVEPFGDHLRTDEDIRFVRDEAGEDRLVLITTARNVAVPAERACAGEFALRRFLHLLGADIA